jgi:hypothetical protein
MTLQMLHFFIQLNRLATQRPPHAPPVTLVMVPFAALRGAIVSLVKTQQLPTPSDVMPLAQQLQFANQTQSALQLLFCSTWEQAAAHANVKALHWSGVFTSFDHLIYQLQHAQFIRCLLHRGAQLYPPQSWDLFDDKKQVQLLFGDALLPTDWFDIPCSGAGEAASSEELHTLCEQLLKGRADGHWVVKGSFSFNAVAVCAIHIQRGTCDKLFGIVERLHVDCRQHCIGIQQYMPELAQLELRVFLVLDNKQPSGWRQCLSLRTSSTFSSNSDESLTMSAELEQPVHGVAKQVAQFVDALLLQHAATFQKAAACGTPLLRIDCFYSSQEKRCFLNELCCANECGLWTHVHYQDLAYVVGEAFARGVWKLLS